MKTKYYSTIKDFCTGHGIEESFVMVLGEYELIDVMFIEQQGYIHKEELPKLEKMVRLYHELGINLEGIEAIYHLLGRVEEMQQELIRLKTDLRRFEN